MLPPDWPPGLCAYLEEWWGHPSSVMRLSGIGGPGAFRVSAPRGVVIVKGDALGREAQFYRRVAPALRQQGVPVPELYWAGESGGQHWTVLEALPAPLPRNRWEGDPAVMAALVRLHGSRLDQGLDGLSLFRPEWTEAMTEAAVSCLAGEGSAAVRAVLLDAMGRSQGLLAPACFISGDPNPTNWGLRGNGSVALFDWERFGRGTPAIDVAITIPGLPSPDGQLERRVAASYLEQWVRVHGESFAGHERLAQAHDEPLACLEQFAGDIRRAKLWTVVEFLGNYAEGRLPESAHTTAERLVEWLPRVTDLKWF